MPRAHVLVTGAAGFIGSHLVRRLRAEGERVVGVDAFRGTTTAARAVARLDELQGDPGFDLVTCDLADDGADLASLTRDAAAVFHLAARPGARDGDVAMLRRDNVRATVRLLEAAAATGVPDLVLASSSSVYGDAGADVPSREDGPVAPLSVYGQTKLDAEHLCRAAPIRARVVRLFTVYGPHQRPDMAFARFVAAALAGGQAPRYQATGSARDYTFVTDAVDGLIRALRCGTAPVYNVSGGAVVALADACQTIEELTGAPVRTRVEDAPPQPRATRADLTLARTQLGYVPQVDLRAGLALQVATARADAAVRAAVALR